MTVSGAVANKPVTTISIVEDDPNYGRSLRAALEAHSNWHIVGPWKTASEALLQLPSSNSDLILLDINLPDGSGIEVARELRTRSVTAPIVMLTIHDDAKTIIEALEAGAQGYLLKGLTGDSIHSEVEAFLSGEASMSPAIARRLVAWFNQRDSTSLSSATAATLTARQKEILEEAARGRSQKQIAQHFDISEHTVKNHFRNIYEKLGVHSLREALVKVKGKESLLES